jgi:hypothetical protein
LRGGCQSENVRLAARKLTFPNSPERYTHTHAGATSGYYKTKDLTRKSKNTYYTHVRKNFYVKPEDEDLFKQIGEENLSALITQLLRRHLEEKRLWEQGLSLHSYVRNFIRYEFLGRHIWPLHPDEADCPDLEALSRRPDPFAEPGIETDIFITSKRKFLMIVVDQAEPFDRFSHRTFDTLPELLEAFGVDAESNLAVYLAYAAGSPVTVKLDV